jgi:hypothetical protein
MYVSRDGKIAYKVEEISNIRLAPLMPFPAYLTHEKYPLEIRLQKFDLPPSPCYV